MIRLVLIALLLSNGGCIQRRIRVTSEPPGAVVWLNDTEIGRTPAEAEFTFYGDYDVRLELPGYMPVHEMRRTVAPFYEYPGPDLIAEVVPHKFEKVFEWHFDLEEVPERTQSPEELEADLIRRARELRSRTEQIAPPDADDGSGEDPRGHPDHT